MRAQPIVLVGLFVSASLILWAHRDQLGLNMSTTDGTPKVAPTDSTNYSRPLDIPNSKATTAPEMEAENTELSPTRGDLPKIQAQSQASSSDDTSPSLKELSAPSNERRASGPFKLSASVQHSCDQVRHLQVGSCDELMAALTNFASEARDPTWATKTEAAIVSAVLQNPEFSVRAIECRETICAAEFESTSDIVLASAFRGLADSLSFVDSNIAYERENGRDVIKVTLVVLKKS